MVVSTDQRMAGLAHQTADWKVLETSTSHDT